MVVKPAANFSWICSCMKALSPIHTRPLIGIFLSVFNVHVNRFPLRGRVIGTKYCKGSFVGAFEEKASLENEQMGILIDHDDRRVLFVQIAGLVARRIVCRVTEGESLERGERYGLIRFGSRMDVYLPMDSKVEVSVGQKVYSGRTKLGEL